VSYLPNFKVGVIIEIEIEIEATTEHPEKRDLEKEM